MWDENYRINTDKRVLPRASELEMKIAWTPFCCFSARLIVGLRDPNTDGPGRSEDEQHALVTIGIIHVQC